jgi:hypothetical protein
MEKVCDKRAIREQSDIRIPVFENTDMLPYAAALALKHISLLKPVGAAYFSP